MYKGSVNISGEAIFVPDRVWQPLRRVFEGLFHVRARGVSRTRVIYSLHAAAPGVRVANG